MINSHWGVIKPNAKLFEKHHGADDHANIFLWEIKGSSWGELKTLDHNVRHWFLYRIGLKKEDCSQTRTCFQRLPRKIRQTYSNKYHKIYPMVRSYHYNFNLSIYNNSRHNVADGILIKIINKSLFRVFSDRQVLSVVLSSFWDDWLFRDYLERVLFI